eukprot:SAG31_NODE_8426_length_1454_cov_4.301107_2_plen_144_part_00
MQRIMEIIQCMANSPTPLPHLVDWCNTTKKSRQSGFYNSICALLGNRADSDSTGINVSMYSVCIIQQVSMYSASVCNVPNLDDPYVCLCPVVSVLSCRVCLQPHVCGTIFATSSIKMRRWRRTNGGKRAEEEASLKHMSSTCS